MTFVKIDVDLVDIEDLSEACSVSIEKIEDYLNKKRIDSKNNDWHSSLNALGLNNEESVAVIEYMKDLL